MTTYRFNIEPGIRCEMNHGYNMSDDGFLHPNPCKNEAIVCTTDDDGDEFYLCGQDNEFLYHLSNSSDLDV